MQQLKRFFHKNRKLLYYSFLLFMISFPLFTLGQMNKWILPPNEIDFSTTPPTASTIPSSPAQYKVSNAAHDEEGNTIFFIKDHEVFDGNGNFAGVLNDAAFPGSNFNYSAENIKHEIALFPLPGTCDTWCVFYLIPEAIGGDVNVVFGIALVMTEITILDDGSLWVQSLPPIKAGVKEYANRTGGLALSKPILGSYAQRNLYVVTPLNVDVLSFTGTGLPSVNTLATYEAQIHNISSEVELSHDGNTLAWGEGDVFGNTIYTLGISPVTPVVAHSYDGPQGIIGLEFGLFNNEIYFTTRKNDINPATLNKLKLSTNDFDFLGEESIGNTQLELAKDGFIYLVGADEKFQKLNFIGTGLEPSNLSVTLNSNGSGIFTLPDQIDGQNYSEMQGVKPIELTGISIDGIFLPTDFSSNGLPDFGLCGPIDLDLDYEGDPVSFTVDIFNISSSNGTPFDCSNSNVACVNETFFLASSFPFDLKCIINDISCDFFDDAVAVGNNTFKMKISLESRCEIVTRTGYFEVFEIPDNVNGVLEINPGSGGSACNASQDINAPCLGGTGQSNIELSSSTGAITFYQIKIDEVNCNTGEVFQTLYDGPQVPQNNPGTIGLNTLEINGVTYFFYANGTEEWLNRCLKIETTVGNNCGSTTNFTYFKFNTLNFQDPNIGNQYIDFDEIEKVNCKGNSSKKINDSSSGFQSKLTFYPNPFKEQLEMTIELEKALAFHLKIINNKGQIISDNNYLMTRHGEQTFSIRMENHPNGIYFYQVTTGATVQTGKIIKIQ